MKKRTRSNKRKPSCFEYGSLEPKMMLSADLDMARNLVTNGDFEAMDAAPFISFADGDDSVTQEVKIRNISTSFSNIAVVDTTAGQTDSLAQDIVTEAGNDYIVSFDLRGANTSGSSSLDTNTVEVLFDGNSIGTFAGTNRWQTFTVAVQASTDLTRLEFRETSTVSDGRGILLDHVALANVEEINVRNGSFENLTGDISDGATNEEVPSINTIPNNPSTPIGVIAVTDAPDRDNVLNLNTSDSRVDRVFTNLRTEANSTYFISFQIRNADATANSDLRVRFDGRFAGSFQATSDWQKVGTLVEADGEFSPLLFRENSSGNSGVQIDNVQLYRVSSLESDYTLDLNSVETGTGNEVDFTENIEENLATTTRLRFANGDTLRSATIRILGFTGTETLSVNTSGDVEANFNSNTGILRLVGRDTVVRYQSILRTLTFNDSNEDPAAETRQVVVSVTDGTVGSARATVDVNVMPVNDAPRADDIADVTIDQNSSTRVRVNVVDPDDTDLTFDVAVTGQDFIFEQTPVIDADGRINLDVGTHGDAWITVTITDPQGAMEEVSFGVNVPFIEPTGEVPNDFAPFSGQRQLTDVLPELRDEIYDSAPAMSIDTNQDYRAIIETTDGEIFVDLFESESPVTVNNFVNLAEDGFYDGRNVPSRTRRLRSSRWRSTGHGYWRPRISIR